MVLTLQISKCYFLKRKIIFLCHIITYEGVKRDPQKIKAVKNFPVPKGKENVKQFSGLIGYYRRFIPNFSRESKPLTLLLKEKIKFKWTKVEQRSFENLRAIMCSEPILQYPEFTKSFVLTTDALNYALVGILSQGPIGPDLTVAFASRTLQSAEINYSTI